MWISLRHDVRPGESTVAIKYSSFIQAAAEKTCGNCVGRLQLDLPTVVLLVAVPGTSLLEDPRHTLKDSGGDLIHFFFWRKFPDSDDIIFYTHSRGL